MKRRVIIVVGLFIVVVAGAALAYASPYITVAKVRRAAERGDADTFNAHVDFLAHRQSAKGCIGASMAKEMATRDTSNPFAVFGMAMAVTMAEKFVDVMTTPETVRMMLEGHEAHDRFVVRAVKKDRHEDEFAMVWLRSGLTWKLSALRLPAPSSSR